MLQEKLRCFGKINSGTIKFEIGFVNCATFVPIIILLCQIKTVAALWF